MDHINPSQKLEIKKGQMWELWMVSPSVPSAKTILGAFKTLEELNQREGAFIYGL